jgi:predicted acyl esterase
MDLSATSNLRRRGHRIGLEVANHNFPHFVRHPQTGHALGADAELLPALQPVFHDREHPSRLVLPLVPR